MDAETIKELVAHVKGATVLSFDNEHHAVIVPDGWSAKDISTMLPPPDRIRQRVELLTLESLIDYASKFKLPDTAIFANETDATYEVVMDYHFESRGDCDHIARYACPRSESWQTWSAHDGKAKSQLEFARFIETNLIDIVKPVSADMLQIVLNLQVHKTADFKGDLRLDNGAAKLSYEETVRGSTRVGDLVIPDLFQLNVPVFIDGARYPLDVRLRYRLDEGKLNLWYELVRPLDVYRAAVKAVSETVRKGLAGVPFWIGKRIP
jgi:uncharacterized protein YfdQ (DUF2303 family)